MMSSFETKVAHSCGCWLAFSFIYLSSSSLRLLSQSELLVLRYYCSSLLEMVGRERRQRIMREMNHGIERCLPVHYFLSFLPLFSPYVVFREYLETLKHQRGAII